MPNKSGTHANEKDRSRKAHRGGRVLSHQPEQVYAADALARTLNAPANMVEPADILALQRTAGNRAVEQLLARGAQPQESRRLTIQTKLTVGAADDPYEREADRVAASVMQGSRPSAPHVQRRLSEAEREEKPVIQRRAVAEHASADPDVERGIEKARGGGQPLPGDLRVRMEQAFAADFSGVRVHTNAEADEQARSLQSLAFTTGNDLFFKNGSYSPDTRNGQEVIAHELTHVLQQGGGRLGNSTGESSAHLNSGAKTPVSPVIQSTQLQLQTKKASRY